MKKIYLAVFLLSSVFLSAQTTVNLLINHKLGSNAFAFNQKSINNLGSEFDVSRLEYYVSGIVLEHDGGSMTAVEDYWILVNAGTDTTYELGAFNITSLEAIHFTIGVDSAHNHLDPSQYALGHPLAPKTPSMHWGWASGYRFLAIEGMSGTAMDQTYEFHSLGDNHYYTQRIPTAGEDVGGDLLITLNGDYSRIIENIDLTEGVIEHGQSDVNIKTLQNMYNFVFTSVEGHGNSLDPLGISVVSESDRIGVYPNPSVSGNIYLDLGRKMNGIYKVEVRDLTGRLIETRTIDAVTVKDPFVIAQSGIYTLSVYDGLQLLVTRRVVISR